MPTNLPPEARAKWIKVMEAKTTEEKIKALEEFISAVPKHKGTENLMYWATRRLSQLKEEAELAKRKKASTGLKFYIEKEGAAQLVMLGEPLSGKTSLLARLTNAKPLATGYPYSTKLPQPGMLKYEDIYFQLIDTPSIPFTTEEQVSWFNRTIGLARNADGVILVIDATREPKRQLERAIEELEKAGIFLKRPRAKIELIKTSKGGINVIVNGKLLDTNVEEIKKMLSEYKIIHAVLKIWGEADLDDIESHILGNKVYKPAIALINKVDLLDSKSRVEKELSAIYQDIPKLFVSAKTGEGLGELGRVIFNSMNIIRVYTKQPNGDIARKPLVLKKGSTVKDVAANVHSNLEKYFRYARVWGKSVKIQGEKVGLDHQLEDGDVVEIYSKI